jgi:hypothetical protein
MPASIVRPDAIITHDPDAELIYAVDWDDWLNDGAEIDDSEWLIEDVSPVPEFSPVLTQDNDAIAGDGRSASVRLMNGTDGHKYKVTHRITTDETPAQTDDRSFFLRVQDR